ncbi:MAG: hypothetical protein WC570_02530 [Patescibacteria group bacterium]
MKPKKIKISRHDKSFSNPYDKTHLKYAICVSGSAMAEVCSANAKNEVTELGRQIALNHAFLITGATTGMPNYAAQGCKEAGGISIGISPAASEKDHVRRYQLPTEYYDLIMYTGFGYSGRNLLLTRMADAIISVCGRIGTLNEFTIAFEDKKPIGVLEDTGGLVNEFRELVDKGYRGPGKIAYDKDPAVLVKKVLKMIEKEKIKKKK